MLPPKELVRHTSEGTEISSLASSSDSEREVFMDGSLLVEHLKEQLKPSVSFSSTRRSSTRRSSSAIQDDDKLLMLSHSLLKERRSILVVRTQQESLQQCIDDRLAQSLRPPNSVSFGQLHVREYARRMGDNPGCRVGVSLTIDWEVQNEASVDFEAYEASRPPRRDRGELNIPAEVRMQMMRDSGYSRGEILQYVKMANIARGQRSRTNETLQLAGVQEFGQRLFRGVLNKSVRRNKKRKERRLLQSTLEKDQTLVALRRQLSPDTIPSQRRVVSSPELCKQVLAEQPVAEEAPVAFKRIVSEPLIIVEEEEEEERPPLIGDEEEEQEGPLTIEEEFQPPPPILLPIEC